MKNLRKQATLAERKIILEYFRQHGWVATIAVYPISKSTLYNWQNAFNKNGDDGLKPQSRKPIRHGRKKVTQEMEDFIRQHYMQKPTSTLANIRRLLKNKENVPEGSPEISRMTICRKLQPIKKESEFITNYFYRKQLLLPLHTENESK